MEKAPKNKILIKIKINEFTNNPKKKKKNVMCKYDFLGNRILITTCNYFLLLTSYYSKLQIEIYQIILKILLDLLLRTVTFFNNILSGRRGH